MPKYSPFDRPITDLHPADLAILTSVSEGWYVDYKRDLIGAGAMAKAVSAFANTYGGWLFLGVRERSKDDPVAGEFPGLSNKDVDVAQQRLRPALSRLVGTAVTIPSRWRLIMRATRLTGSSRQRIADRYHAPCLARPCGTTASSLFLSPRTGGLVELGELLPALLMFSGLVSHRCGLPLIGLRRPAGGGAPHPVKVSPRCP